MYCELPNKEARLTLIEKCFEQVKHTLTKADFEALANSTEGFTCSDIRNMVDRASMLPIEILATQTHFYLGKDSLYRPCGASCPGAIEITLSDLPQGRVADVDFTRVDEKGWNEP